MPRDLPTRPTSTAPGVSGFKPIELDRIFPIIPERFETAEDFNAAQQILKLRREIMQRQTAIPILQGRMRRHNAEQEGCILQLKTAEERLRAEDVKEDRRAQLRVNREDLIGRVQMAVASAEACRQKIRQFELEIMLYQAALGEET